MANERSATLYRMVLPEHVCPYGVRAKELLDQACFEVDDRQLTSRDEVEDLKEELGVATTPQIFIAEERIGGCSELETYLIRS